MEAEERKAIETSGTTESQDNSHLLSLYTCLAGLRATGESTFTSLSSAYLTALSILLATIGVILASDHVNRLLWAIKALSASGLFIALVMYIAQHRLTARYYIYDQLLNLLEQKLFPKEWRIFTRTKTLCKGREKAAKGEDGFDFNAPIPLWLHNHASIHFKNQKLKRLTKRGEWSFLNLKKVALVFMVLFGCAFLLSMINIWPDP